MLTHLLIVNPVAGRGLGARRRRLAERLLDAGGLAYETFVTRAPGDARRVAREEAPRYSVIVALGGDGTVQEVAGGLAELRLARTPTDTRPLAALGILPAGTGNDLIRGLRLPMDFAAACRRLCVGQPRALDLGRLRWREAGNPAEQERLFVNNVGLGFEGQVGWAANRLRLPLRGKPLYLLALLRVLARLGAPRLALTWDGVESPPRPLLLLSVGNGSCSGGGFKLNPLANPFDGRLDACAVDARSRLEVLRLLPRGIKGTHLGLPGVESRRFTRLGVRSETPFAGHADGELLSERMLAADFEVLPGLLPALI